MYTMSISFIYVIQNILHSMQLPLEAAIASAKR